MSANKSAQKRVRTSEKARIRHKSRRSALKTSEKKFSAFIETAEMDKAKDQLKDVFKKLDKAVKAGTLHKNKRDRKKARLSAALGKTA
jgi:small subunit ribosomal protein S20